MSRGNPNPARRTVRLSANQHFEELHMKRAIAMFLSLSSAGLIGLSGCGKEKGTTGGPGATDPNAKKPMVGQQENTFTISSSHTTVYVDGKPVESSIGISRGTGFDQDVSVAFLGDGVYQLVKGGDTKGVEMKNFSRSYGALDDYDVNQLYVEQEAMQARGLVEADLVVPVEVVSAERMAEIMESQDVILSF